MSLYGFPILSIPDILVGLADMFDINIEEASFRKPDPAHWQEIFLRILCEVTGCPVDSHIQQALMVQEFEHPELFNDSIPLMHLFITMKKLLTDIGVVDFGHVDLASPSMRRLQKICSGLINFQRFKMTRLETFEAIEAGIGQQREHHDTLLKRNEELKQKINAIKAERAQQEPEVIKVQEQIEQSSARMQEHHRNQSAIQKSITEVKTKITERKAYADQLKLAILKSKEDSERLSTKIVQSPDRVRHEQEDMERQLRLLKEGLERKRHRLTEIQNQRENIRKSASDSEKGLQLLEAIQGSINKENEVDAEIAQISDKYQDLNHQQREFCTRRDQLQHMLTTRQEKVAKLSLQHQSRMKVLQEQLAAAKIERESYIQKQSSDAQKKNEKLEYKKKKEEELKQKQKLIEQKIRKMNEVYSRLLESNDKYDRQFENYIEDIRKMHKK